MNVLRCVFFVCSVFIFFLSFVMWFCSGFFSCDSCWCFLVVWCF